MNAAWKSSNWSRALCAAVCFGVNYGMLSALLLVTLSFYEPPLSGLALSAVNAHLIWLGPMFDVPLFAGIALFVLGVSKLNSREDAVRRVWHALFFAAVLGLLLAPARLHRVAAVILALGITVMVARVTRGIERRLPGLTWRSAALAFAAWAALGAGIVGYESWAERTRVQQLPSTQAGQPNVLLIVLDTLRADHLSAYGYHRATTPHLDALAAEGALFSRAVATSSWTLPSHASLFTGLSPREHGASTVALDSKIPTLAEALAGNGYVTAGFVANSFMVHERTGLARGFLRYEDLFYHWREAGLKTVYGRRILPPLLRAAGWHDLLGRKTAADINAAFLNWLDTGRPAGRPFFAFLNYFDVHDPYLPPEAFAGKFTSNASALLSRVPLATTTSGGKLHPPDLIRMELNAYDAALSYLDWELGQLFDRLRAQGVLDNTIVVITSDHGEEFGEHGHFGHAVALYRESIHVPLIVRYPSKVPAGLRDERPVDLTRIPATIQDLAGLRRSLPGSSLLPFAQSAAEEGAFAEIDAELWSFQPRLQGKRILRSVVTSEWHLIVRPKGQLELYQWNHDVREITNQALRPESQAVLAELQKTLGRRGHAERADD